MAYQLGEMSAAVTLDVSQYNRKMNQLPQTGAGIFKKLAGLAAGYFSARQIAGFAVSSIAAFRDMEEATSKFNVTFKNVATSANRVANELTNVYGLSTQSAKTMLANTGDLLIGFGFSSKAAIDLAEQTAKLGIDLASFNNYAGGARGAAEALTKGMLGETESLKALGIVIRQDSDEYKNMVAQMKRTKGVTDQQAQAMAVLELATKQSGNAIGDYLRPGETLAQQQSMMVENFLELKAAAGAFLAELFNVPGAMKSVNDTLKSITSYIKTTSAEWVYAFQYVWAEIEAGAKTVWAFIEPAVSYVGEIVMRLIENIQTGFQNVVSVGGWVFENLGTFVSNFGKLAGALGEDILNVFMNLPGESLDTFFALGKGICEILANVGKNIWNVLSGKMSLKEAVADSLATSSETAKQTLGDVEEANRKLFSELGSNTDKVLREIGATPFPELKMPVNPFVDPANMIEEYSNIGSKLDEINRDKLREQQEAEARYREKLNQKPDADKNDDGQPDNASTATNKAVGTFIAASLAQLMGSSTPEKETAKSAKNIEKKLDKMNPVYS